MSGMSVEVRTRGETATVAAVQDKPTPPSQWRVVFLNDDVTTMEFVVCLLREIFQYETERAVAKMMEVHTRGRASVGVYPKSIAAAKCQQCHDLAREAGYPLRVIMEEANGDK